MIHLRLLHLATSAGLCGSFYISHLINSNSAFKVNAQPALDKTFVCANVTSTDSDSSAYETPAGSSSFRNISSSLDETLADENATSNSMVLRHSDLSVDASCIHAPNTTYSPTSSTDENSISFHSPCKLCDPTFQCLTSTPIGAHDQSTCPGIDQEPQFFAPFGEGYFTPCFNSIGSGNLGDLSHTTSTDDLNLHLSSSLSESDNGPAGVGLDSSSDSPVIRPVQGFADISLSTSLLPDYSSDSSGQASGEESEYHISPVEPLHRDPNSCRVCVWKGARICFPPEIPEKYTREALKSSSYTSLLPGYEEPTSPTKERGETDRGQRSPVQKRDLSGGSGHSGFTPEKRGGSGQSGLSPEKRGSGSGQSGDLPEERNLSGGRQPAPLCSPEKRELGGSGQRMASPAPKKSELCVSGHRTCPPAPKKVEIRWAPLCECKRDNKHSPNVSDVKGYDFTVCRNYETGVPNWTLQHLVCSVGDHCGCRYCKSVRFPCARECETEVAVDIKKYCDVDLDPCVFQVLPPQPSRCERQNNSLWDDFYHYTLYLAEKYERIYVCSIPGYPQTGCNPDHASNPTHFYKVIVTKEKSGTYQFECYRFENKQIPIKNPELVNYRVLKGRVERETGLKLFPLITGLMVGTKRPHFSGFIPHRDCPICFPTEPRKSNECQ